METQVSLDEKIRSTFGRALLEALSENAKSHGKRGAASHQTQAVKVKEKRYNIMLVSLEGYPAAYSSRGPEALDQLQKDFYEIVEAAAVAHRGSIVKSTESSCLITFDTSTDVLRAGLKIESTVARYNKDNEPINSKIVINTDEVVSEEWGDLFKKFMNRVIQKEKIASVAERAERSDRADQSEKTDKAERAGEAGRVTAKREVNWGGAKPEGASKPAAASSFSGAAPVLEPTTRTITEKRLASAPRTPVKVVTHKRELPEGAQQFSPHFIHSDMPVSLEQGPDWSHRLFLLVVTLLLAAGGFFALKAIVHRAGGLEHLQEKLGRTASMASSFIHSKILSGGKNIVPVPLADEIPAIAPISAAPAAPAPVVDAQAAPAAPARVSAAEPADAAAASPAAVVTDAPGKTATAEDLKRYADLGEPVAERIARYRTVIRKFPGTLPAHEAQVEIGKIRIQQGQITLSKEIFNELLAMSPAPEESILAESHYQLGIAYWKEKDYASARWCFERVIKLYPRVAPIVEESQKMLAAIKQDAQ